LLKISPYCFRRLFRGEVKEVGLKKFGGLSLPSPFLGRQFHAFLNTTSWGSLRSSLHLSHPFPFIPLEVRACGTAEGSPVGPGRKPISLAIVHNFLAGNMASDGSDFAVVYGTPVGYTKAQKVAESAQYINND